MTIDHINIRAVRCLEWDRRDLNGSLAFKNPNDGCLYRVDQLDFDSSLDWSKIGVVEVFDNGFAKEFFEKLGIVEDRYTFGGALVSLIRFTTPKQITQAWVEVLEDDRFNKKHKAYTDSCMKDIEQVGENAFGKKPK